MRSLFFLLFLLGSGTAGFAQEGFFGPDGPIELSQSEGDRLFQQAFSFQPDVYEPTRIRIASDFKQFKRKKFREEYQPATLRVRLSEDQFWQTDIQIRPRGKSRLSICQHPPIKFKTVAEGDYGEELDRLDNLKLVNKCRNGKPYEEYIYKEFLAYRLFNALTDHSYRVQLLELSYEDTGRRKNKTSQSPAFLIETHAQLAERMGLDYAKDQAAPQDLTDPEHMALLAVFQYMIGNTDWSVKRAHNCKFFVRSKGKGSEILPIPYDFDYSGLVNASYAVSPEQYGLSGVTERLYRGDCSLNDRLPGAVALFLEKKGTLLGIVRAFPYLDENTRTELVDYLEDFFREMEGPRGIEHYLTQTCQPNR